MIKKAVFSYFNAEESFGNKGGFIKFSDLLYTTALSVICASKRFPEVQVISSSWGVDILSQLNLPVTSFSNKLDEMKNISRFFWAYGKLIAYAEQTEPFVHIDNDVFLWERLPERLLNAPLCFQSLEPFDLPGYHYYRKLKPCFKAAPVKPEAIAKHPVNDFAYNCGICGGNDLSIFQEWKECSHQYITAPENEEVFFKQFPHMLIHQNLFHEQYFLASLVRKHKMRDKVEILHEDAMKINDDLPQTKPRYTHLWGTTKRDTGMMAKVRMTLLYQKPEVFQAVNKYCVDHEIKL